MGIVSLMRLIIRTSFVALLGLLASLQMTTAAGWKSQSISIPELPAFELGNGSFQPDAVGRSGLTTKYTTRKRQAARADDNVIALQAARKFCITAANKKKAPKRKPMKRKVPKHKPKGNKAGKRKTLPAPNPPINQAQAITIYVNANATGANNGSSWGNAFTALQSALDLAKTGDEIWVARGSYRPTAVNPLDIQLGNGSDLRAKTFFLKDGVHVFGGFAGSETTRSERNTQANPTILSGDFAENDGWPVTTSNKNSYSENAYHVVFAYRLNSKTVLDGFTVTGGYAGPNPTAIPDDYDPWSDPHACGGGVASYGSNLWIENCAIKRNAALMGGGGLFADSGNVNIGGLQLLVRSNKRVDIRSTVFKENTVPDYRLNGGIFYVFGGGGALVGDSYTARLYEVEFISNSAPNGGALTMYRREQASTAASASAYRCLFYGNQALCSPDDPQSPGAWVTDGQGGAIHVTHYAKLAIDSCAFISNEASSNGYSVNADQEIRYGGNGGAFDVTEGGNVKVSNSGFIRNKAGWAGGAMDVGTYFEPASATSLEIYFCTVYENQARWSGGLGNYKSSVSGYGNIFYKNWRTFGSGNYNDLGNTTQVSSKSYIKESVFTYYDYFDSDGQLDGNIGKNYFIGGEELPNIFSDPSNPAGLDGDWGTADDGFVLTSGSLPLDKVNSPLPPDFADADDDGNTTESLPFDLKRVSFGISPYDCGPYQR